MAYFPPTCYRLYLAHRNIQIHQIVDRSANLTVHCLPRYGLVIIGESRIMTLILDQDLEAFKVCTLVMKQSLQLTRIGQQYSPVTDANRLLELSVCISRPAEWIHYLGGTALREFG